MGVKCTGHVLVPVFYYYLCSISFSLFACVSVCIFPSFYSVMYAFLTKLKVYIMRLYFVELPYEIDQ